MSIPDGTRGTVINGAERQDVSFHKVAQDEDTETFDVVREKDAAEPVDTPQVAADTGTWADNTRHTLNDAPPVLPSYLRKWSEFTSNAWLAICYAAYLTAFHAVRLPVYLMRLVRRSPRGAWQLTRAWFAWVVDAESRPAAYEAANAGDPQLWIAFSSHRSRRIKPRLITSATLGAVSLLGGLIAWFLAAVWQLLLAVVAVLALLGACDRRTSKPIVTRFVSRSFQRPLDSNEVERALIDIGHKSGVDWVNPIQTDGPGWLAEFDLLGGTLAETLVDKRKHLAAAMRRPLQCVWPSVGTEHPARVNLWIAKRDPRSIKRPWPLLKSGTVDMYGAFPFGFTPRGEAVPMTLAGGNMLIGGVMGSGKTSATAVIACATVLDVTAKLMVFELKGSGDVEGLRPCCHVYVQGDDDEHCEASLNGAVWLEHEMKRRKDIIAKLPIEDVPNGRKVSRKIAEKYPDLHLEPIVAIFDEVHTLFEHDKYGKLAEPVFNRLIRKARAYGIIVVLTTQRPTTDSIPKKVADNAIIRFCLSVTGQVANDLVLGTGMWRRGIRASIFEPAEGDDPKDSGTGWLTRSAVNARIVRAYFNTQPEIRDVGKRALAMRTAAGRLTGEAAGETVDLQVATIVDHLHAVWPDGAEAVHSHRLVPALTDLVPEVYGPWMDTDKPEDEMTPDEVRDVQTARSTALSAALKTFKVPTRQITLRECCGGAKGVRYADLPEPADALAEAAA